MWLPQVPTGTHIAGTGEAWGSHLGGVLGRLKARGHGTRVLMAGPGVGSVAAFPGHLPWLSRTGPRLACRVSHPSGLFPSEAVEAGRDPRVNREGTCGQKEGGGQAGTARGFRATAQEQQPSRRPGRGSLNRWQVLGTGWGWVSRCHP